MAPATLNTFPEYSGAGPGIIGWRGVRSIGSISARRLGFMVWIVGGLLLIAWAVIRELVNGVNVVMAAPALMALV